MLRGQRRSQQKIKGRAILGVARETSHRRHWGVEMKGRFCLESVMGSAWVGIVVSGQKWFSCFWETGCSSQRHSAHPVFPQNAFSRFGKWTLKVRDEQLFRVLQTGYMRCGHWGRISVFSAELHISPVDTVYWSAVGDVPLITILRRRNWCVDWPHHQ